MILRIRYLVAVQVFTAAALAAGPVYFVGTVTNSTCGKQPQTAFQDKLEKHRQAYLAQLDRKKRARLYDADSEELRPPHRESFRTRVADTDTSSGQLYSTTTQRLGAFTYSSTYGTGGFQASSATQRLGPFHYTSGISSHGPFYGFSQRIGNFDYSTFTTSSGTWTGIGQRVGNFTFYNFTGPDGQSLSGASQRIGAVIYTELR
jgi:hypothetical protein